VQSQRPSNPSSRRCDVFIASESFIQTLTNELEQQTSNISDLQLQLSTGQALNRASDNPAAVTQVLALSSQAAQLTSWQNNVQTATSWLGIANSTANNILTTLQSARTLLLQAMNSGTQSSSTYQALGTQLQGVSNNLLSLSNTQYADRAIFAGTSASLQAYDASGNYLGNADVSTVVIGPGSGVGEAVNLSVPGSALFGPGASNAFATLSGAISALQSGAPPPSSISLALNELDAVISGAQQASAVLGQSSQMVTSAAANLATEIATIESNRANLENVNVAGVTTQLTLETTDYQAALWATSKAVPETLVNFL